jgi:large subunit ribosomal protein L15
MDLSNLKPAKGSTHKRKRVGRGQGSDLGQTAGRGNNGAKSRSGYRINPGFEGGGYPLYRRVPKFGFKNRNQKTFVPLNLEKVQHLADKHGITDLNKEQLIKLGVVKRNQRLKVLGRGSLQSKVQIEADAFSKGAKEAIESAGGQAKNLRDQ